MRRQLRYLVGYISLFVIMTSASLANSWKGAEICSHDTLRYGAVEARLRAGSGSGVITPFFLLKDGTQYAGTAWQEMDFEAFGRSGGSHYQTQVMTPGNPRTQHLIEVDAGSSLTQYYHTYRMEWTPSRLAFFFDGRLVREERDQNTYGKLLNPNSAEPMRLRFSIWAASNNWSGYFDENAMPSHVFVSYVRFELYTPGSGPGGSDFSLKWQDDFQYLDYQRWYLLNEPADTTAVNDFTSANATVRDGTLVLSLTKDSAQGFYGRVPHDPWKWR